MTRDEQRLAWRFYAAAVLTVEDVRMQDVARCADTLLEEERKRFDGPDHSGDANKMVEPRPWVGLTLDQVVDLLLNSRCSAYAIRADLEDLLRRAENMLRANNGGTR